MTNKKKYTHNPLKSKFIHSYEPISQKTKDEYELVIDKDTLWVPTCKTKEGNLITDADLIAHEDYLYAQRLMEHRDLRTRIIIAKLAHGGELTLSEMRHYEAVSELEDCQECLVIDLCSHLDLLDIMPLEEVLYKSKDEDEDDTPEDWEDD